MTYTSILKSRGQALTAFAFATGTATLLFTGAVQAHPPKAPEPPSVSLSAPVAPDTPRLPDTVIAPTVITPAVPHVMPPLPPHFAFANFDSPEMRAAMDEMNALVSAMNAEIHAAQSELGRVIADRPIDEARIDAIADRIEAIAERYEESLELHADEVEAYAEAAAKAWEQEHEAEIDAYMHRLEERMEDMEGLADSQAERAERLAARYAHKMETKYDGRVRDYDAFRSNITEALVDDRLISNPRQRITLIRDDEGWMLNGTLLSENHQRRYSRMIAELGHTGSVDKIVLAPDTMDIVVTDKDALNVTTRQDD